VTCGADQLILLSDVDGFYNGNPNLDPAATRYDVIDRITPEIEAMAGDGVSGLSKGGMITKLLAARMATEAGCAMAITLGSRMNPLRALEDGATVTWFTAHDDPQAARKRWIAAMKPKGELVVDAGAETALSAGKSLLPAGVRAVRGTFGRGEPVAIVTDAGKAIGIGLTRYTSAEALQIIGRRSADIEEILGYKGRAALVHRDDMVVQ
jgi:glutamate 5-kinase